jgi:hypothetical protein
MRVSHLFVVILGLASNAYATEATDVQPRRALPDRTQTFVDKSYGFTLDVPKHFRLTGDEAGLLYFQSSEKPGIIVVRPTPGMGLANVQQLMRSGFESRITKLKTKGAPLTLNITNGQGMTMEVDGTLQDQPIEGYLAGIFGSNDQGYMVLIGAVTNKWPILKPDALSILESFTLTPVQRGFEYERWRYRLAGRRLIFVKGYGTRYRGAAFTSDLILCSDGAFRGETSSTTSNRDPLWGSSYSYSGKKKSGDWRVGYDGIPYLRVDFKRGGFKIAPIEFADGYFFLDGRPYQTFANDYCE